MRKIHKKQKLKETKDKRKKKTQNRGISQKQKVIVNIGSLTKPRRRRTNNNKVASRPSDKLGIHSLDVVKYDVSPLQAQIIQQAESIKLLRDKNDDSKNESKALVLYMQKQQQDYNKDVRDIHKRLENKDNDDIKPIYKKLITHHNSVNPPSRFEEVVETPKKKRGRPKKIHMPSPVVPVVPIAPVAPVAPKKPHKVKKPLETEEQRKTRLAYARSQRGKNKVDSGSQQVLQNMQQQQQGLQQAMNQGADEDKGDEEE